MMPLLRDEDRRQLEQIFSGRLVDPVTLVLFTQHESPLIVPAQECQTCRETRQLLEELAQITDKIQLAFRCRAGDGEGPRRRGLDNIPAIIWRGKNKGTLRFSGTPAGSELAVFVEDTIDLSPGPPRLSDETRQQLSALTEPVHIKVMVTPT